MNAHFINFLKIIFVFWPLHTYAHKRVTESSKDTHYSRGNS